MPVYMELLDFLEKRADCGIEIAERTPTKQSEYRKTSQQDAFITKRQLQCPACEGTVQGEDSFRANKNHQGGIHIQ